MGNKLGPEELIAKLNSSHANPYTLRAADGGGVFLEIAKDDETLIATPVWSREKMISYLQWLLRVDCAAAKAVADATSAEKEETEKAATT